GFRKRKMVDASALDDGSRLAPVNDPVWMLVMMLFIVFFRIIIACDLHDISTLLCVLPRHIVRAYRDPAILLRIKFQYGVHQHPGDVLASFIGMGIINLIADAPHDQARMVPVPQYPASDVPMCPILEEPGKIIWRLRSFPHIKSFRDNK